MRILSTNGKRFRTLGSDDKGEETLDVVIVNASPLARSYYDKEYDPSRNNLPRCWSGDTIIPAEAVPEEDRQAFRCLDCVQNIKNSNGSRSCRYFQYVAVVMADDFETVYRLKLSAGSIFGTAAHNMRLQQYARLLSEHNTASVTVVTRIQFDPSSNMAQVVFKPARVLSEVELKAVTAMIEHPDAIAAINVDDFPQPSSNSPFSVEDGFETLNPFI